MADNITAPAAGTVLATDDVGGVHYPITKLAFGALDSAALVRDADGFRFPVAVGGTVNTTALTDTQLRAAPVPVSASALPLPTGAAAEATLAALSAKIAALEAGRTPVAVQALATTTRAYGYAAGQRLTTAGAGQVRSTAITATEVLLHASVRGFFRVGDGTVSASVGAGSIPLEAGEKFHLQITSGEFISFIRDGASDGSLTIMPVA